MEDHTDDRTLDSQHALAFAEHIISTLREPFVVLDKSLRVRTANAAFYRDFHASKDDTEGRFIYELGNGQWDIPRLRALLAQILSNSHPVEDFEVEHDFPALGRRSMLLNARRFPPGGDDADLVLLAIEDDTDRKRAEAAVRSSERRQRFILESIPQKLATARPNGDVDYFNPQWAEFTGLTFDQIRDWGWKQVIHPDDLAEHVRAWRHSITTGERFEFESRFRRADGEYRWHVSRAVPMRDEAGGVVMWVGSNTDVHDIKRAEIARTDSEVRFRRLFESAQDGILILDAGTGKVIDANPFMTALLGYPHDEFVGKELWEIGLFRDIDESRAAYRELQEKGYVRYENLPLESRSGHKVEVEFVSNVYAEGQHQVVQCNVRDITERSRLQRQVKEQAAALADLDRRKDEFLATLAHELRNPLAPIRNSLQIMKLPRVDAATVERSRNVIERQVQQMVRLVDDLMDVSRIVQGKVELRTERVELATVVARAVETARPIIDAKGHDLAITIPTESLPLEADVVRLAQVVGNLLTNAAKYTEPGGRIRLSARRDGDEAVLRVTDTGIGIAPDMLPKVFDLFVQVDPIATRSQGGLGIGLMLVKNLVGLHGGTVEAHSGGLGAGSEFVVRLPLMSPGRVQPEVSDAGERPNEPHPGRRLLVVDDNVDAAESLATLLGLGGHEVRVAHGGTDALAVATDYRPEMVFLDIGMPGMDGYEVARRLRTLPGLGRAVLVALTGWGSPDDRRRTTEAGFDHHLVKPVEPAVLAALLAGSPRRT
ncbi:hybrid sensor histidine kinase/response regulator [Frigoriglobus tundricola]|uniref:histidine kinase n=1 Tax=Frigoriglobus tundricola TaxID=2774151 RepID=A0A6M5Z440_9BACT|nr:PAS domain S-box protein [Frigoriglobus tundricola]QJX01190.1 Histidine kinase [Frigoriglobus tundricola]